MIDLTKYAKFVDAVTSSTSKNPREFQRRIESLETSEVNIARLATASIGLSGEVGEFNEHVKKVLFHGKDIEDKTDAMKSELGDIMWYWINACTALKLNPNDVIEYNVNKLKERHPDGEFNPHYSSDSVE
jgi:NTP pyrophosphatase (non-canonical NTP hydrolase)